MRTAFFLLSSALILGACSDKQQPTGPTNTRSPVTVPSADVAPTGQTVLGQAKPQPAPSGFTKVTRVLSALTEVAPNSTLSAAASCPAGTTIIGGGYLVPLPGLPGAQPFVRYSDATNQNGWSVELMNFAAGATVVSFYAVAFCVS